MPELKESQRRAIYSDSPDILVTASAGTGKTFVMVRRILRLLLEGKADVENLLIVTFMSKAAAEMKERLFLALSEAYAESGDARLKTQIEKLGSASISTLHSVCGNLTRSYFYAAGVDPKFEVMDEGVASELRFDAMNAVFDRKYAEKDGAFKALIAALGRGRTDLYVREMVTKTFEFAESLVDPQAFLADLSAHYHEADAFVLRAEEEMLSSALSDGEALFLKAFLPNESRFDEETKASAKAILAEFAKIAQEGVTEKKLEGLLGALSSFKPTCSEEEKKVVIKAYIALQKGKEVAATTLKKGLEDSRADKDAIAMMRPHADTVANLVREFAKEYATLKQKANKLDFNDLERGALRVLANEEIRAELNARYSYVFVDEYQDTNAVQEEILNRIRGKNLFMVGDVKQSIYAFRRCTPTIFLEKMLRFLNGEGEVIALQDNFRSEQNVLDTVNLVFSRLMREGTPSDYDKISMLTAGKTFPVQYPAEVLLYPKVAAKKRAGDVVYRVSEVESDGGRTNAETEADLIAEEILRCMKTVEVPEEDGLRPLRFSDIVLLSRSVRNDAEVILRRLAEWGIPVSSGGNINLLDYAEVRVLHSLISILDNFNQDVPLIAVLRSSLFGFTDDDLAAIRGENKGAFYECLKLARQEDGVLAEKVNEFFAAYEKYRLDAHLFGTKHALLLAIREREFEVAVRLLHAGERKLDRVSAFLECLSNDLPGETLRKFDALNNELVADETASGDCVRLMSVHKSKGLEFPVVFVILTGKKFNVEQTNSFILSEELGLSLRAFDREKNEKRDTSLFLLSRAAKNREEREEELRILYVAMTRAKLKLIVTGGMSEKDFLAVDELITDGEGARGAKDFATMVVRTLRDEAQRGIYDVTEDGFVDLGCVKMEMTTPGLPHRETVVFEAEQNGEITAAVRENLRFRYPNERAVFVPTKASVTELNARAEETGPPVPVLFVERDEEAKADAIKLGTAYHAVLQHADLLNLCEEEVRRTVEDLVKREIVEEEIASRIDCERVLRIGALPVFSNLAGKKFYREKPFILAVPDRASGEKTLVQGIIDLFIVDNDGVTIVDYKHTSERSEDVLIARYGTQIRLYARAVNEVLKLPVKRCVLVNLKTGREILIPEKE